MKPITFDIVFKILLLFVALGFLLVFYQTRNNSRYTVSADGFFVIDQRTGIVYCFGDSGDVANTRTLTIDHVGARHEIRPIKEVVGLSKTTETP